MSFAKDFCQMIFIYDISYTTWCPLPCPHRWMSFCQLSFFFLPGINADVLVDRVHKYYWCKVFFKIQTDMISKENILNNFHSTKTVSGAKSRLHFLDLPPSLRSPVFRRETKNRATAHLSQVFQLNLADLIDCTHGKQHESKYLALACIENMYESS